MADNTKIEWSDATWNPVTGCTKVSAGCDNCYAETFAERWRGTPGHYFEQGFDVQLRPDKLDQPMHWKKPRKVFVNSMSDLFHDSVPDRFIGEVFSVMGAAKQHTFQLLTKRHGRLRSLLNRWSEHLTKGCYCPDGEGGCSAPVDVLHGRWPLPNVHVGVSVENQQWADIRIPALLDTPAAVRWISAEPLLGPIELADEWLPCCCDNGVTRDENWSPDVPGQRRSLGDGLIPCGLCNLGNWEERTHTPLGWVVAGGESGPGARPMHPDWARSLRDQCVDAGVAFHFKQHGDWVPESMWLHRTTAPAAFLSANGATRLLVDGKPTAAPMSRGQDITIRRVGKKAAGRELDGRVWDEFPAPLALVSCPQVGDTATTEDREGGQR